MESGKWKVDGGKTKPPLTSKVKERLLLLVNQGGEISRCSWRK